MIAVSRKHIFFFLALLLFAASGISVFSMPAHEIYFACDEPFRFCSKEDTCLAQMNVTVGNTGSKLDELVTVQFVPEIEELLLMPMAVRNHGKVPRRFDTQEADESFHIILSDMKPKDSVVLALTIDANKVSDDVLCATLLRGVESAHGNVRKGLPEGVRFLRILYFLFA